MRAGQACLVTALMLATLPVVAQQAAPPVDADRISPTAKYSQTDAVRARFPDIPVTLVAPSFAKAAPALTSQAEMEAFLTDKIAASPRAHVTTIGKSGQGWALSLVVLTKEGVKSLDAARALKRPVVWFIGQQHGNEPAGGEAMLAFAHALAQGPLAPMLDRVTVAIVPRANPDGAAADKRGVANGADLNRDHILLTLEETQAIHIAMQALPPDVVFDHHEFSVANRWVEKFGGLQKADAMLLAATNPMIAPEVKSIANDLIHPRVESALAKFGLVPFVYVTTSFSKSDPIVSTGGTAPGIARNAFGLTGAVSYLVETRGVGIALESWQRRVATHYVIAEAVLGAVSDSGGALTERLAAGRKSVAASREALAVSVKLLDAPVPMPFVDPVTGADKQATVTLRDSRSLTVTTSRQRPFGYLVTDGADDTAERLARNGVIVCRLASALEVDVEHYRIANPPKQTNRESINPEQTVKVEIAQKRGSFAAGTLFLPMSQPAAGILTAALEPDSPGSFVGVGLMPIQAGEAPVYRLMQPLARPEAVTCTAPRS